MENFMERGTRTMAAYADNDERIIELQKLIEEKEKAIKNTSFSPKTPCILNVDGERYNLHVTSKDNLHLLWCKLYSLKLADAEFSKKFKNESRKLIYHGFSIDDWLSDIECSIIAEEKIEEKLKLKNYKEQLNNLLSEGKKTEILLDEIMKGLKG